MVTPAVRPIRFVALDMHKHYVMVGAVNKAQEVLLRPRKFTWPEFDRWCRQHISGSNCLRSQPTSGQVDWLGPGQDRSS